MAYFFSGTLQVPERTYKLALHRVHNSDVALIGSSVGHPLQQDMFSPGVRFTNLGRTMVWITDGPAVVRDLLEVHVPKLLLIVFDMAWANENSPNQSLYQAKKSNGWNTKTALGPYTWLVDGTLDEQEFARLITPELADPGRRGFGLRAIRLHAGYDKFGSFHFSPAWLHPAGYKSEDSKFKETLRRIDASAQRFEYGERASEETIALLGLMVSAAERLSVTTRIVIAPWRRRSSLKNA